MSSRNLNVVSDSPADHGSGETSLGSTSMAEEVSAGVRKKAKSMIPDSGRIPRCLRGKETCETPATDFSFPVSINGKWLFDLGRKTNADGDDVFTFSTVSPTRKPIQCNFKSDKLHEMVSLMELQENLCRYYDNFFMDLVRGALLHDDMNVHLGPSDETIFKEREGNYLLFASGESIVLVQRSFIPESGENAYYLLFTGPDGEERIEIVDNWGKVLGLLSLDDRFSEQVDDLY